MPYPTFYYAVRLRGQGQTADYYIYHIEKQVSKEYLNNPMKVKQLKSPKTLKTAKRVSEADHENIRTKVCMPKSDEEYLSPMHIKLPKSKPRGRKEQKSSKNSTQFEEKTTKRKQKKKPMQETNSASIFNDNIEFLATVKEDKAMLKLKAKPTDKTFRNSTKNHHSTKQVRYQFTEPDSLKIQSKINQSHKKNSCQGLNIPQQQYMFIGDEFYLINNYYPTKRLLNTFRDICTLQNHNESKFITQDKSEKVGKQKIDIKRNNIFMAARKEIEMKNKVQKAVVIQRWWRRMITKHDLHFKKANPQAMAIHNVSPIKNSYDSFEDINSITPIKPYLEDISKQDNIISPSTPPKKCSNSPVQILSFNSAEMMEEKPKKVSFKQEDLSKMIVSYKLPQNGEVDHSENQAIFSSYSKFRMNDCEQNHSESEESSESLTSPRKDDSYPSPTKEPIFDDKEPNFQLLREFHEAAKIKELIDHRILSQKGQTRPSERVGKVGISTSILSIHNMLINFFHFYINKYRDEFLSLINMPYGYSIGSRLRALSGEPLPEEIYEDESGILYGLKDIIDDEKLEDYFKCVELRQNKMNNSFSKANFQLQKIHFKAVLDYFNHELNQYRPYKQIGGVPYPWNHSYKALTFYFVTEENIAEVFEKAELKVLKSTSLLCGIIIPQIERQNEPNRCESIEGFMQQYQKDNYGLILEHNQAKQVKLIHQDVKNEAFEHDFEMFSCVLLEVANEVMRELVLETTLQFPGFNFQSLIY